MLKDAKVGVDAAEIEPTPVKFIGNCIAVRTHRVPLERFGMLQALSSCRRYSCAAWDELDRSWRGTCPPTPSECCVSPWVRTALGGRPSAVQRLHVADLVERSDAVKSAFW